MAKEKARRVPCASPTITIATTAATTHHQDRHHPPLLHPPPATTTITTTVTIRIFLDFSQRQQEHGDGAFHFKLTSSPNQTFILDFPSCLRI
ncbi:hypothetical protein L2E82_01624 [Cichorium intybus]|uniref:Uncharacterized protein n=1 Tax=Cichorium intybus TaxID=13427 RepID=A0ACB9H0P2_CICIN|nr:hypothetical protein L2E82_01624 [Cichorium intybus]